MKGARMYSIGPSSYQDLRGIDQLIATDRMAQQFWSVKVDFDAWMAKQGRTGRLSANEGFRSKDRCYYLWDHRATLGIVVAPPLTSRHYKNPNAIDFGITEPMGMNRALAPDEFPKLHELVEQRGGTWTGVNFGEEWHHEMGTRLEVFPPYPNARAIAEAGPTPVTSPAPKPDPIPIPLEDDMARLIAATGGNTRLTNTIAYIDGLRAVKRTNSETQAYRLGRVTGQVEPGHTKDAQIREDLKKDATVLVTELAEHFRATVEAGGYVDPYYRKGIDY